MARFELGGRRAMARGGLKKRGIVLERRMPCRATAAVTTSDIETRFVNDIHMNKIKVFPLRKLTMTFAIKSYAITGNLCSGLL